MMFLISFLVTVAQASSIDWPKMKTHAVSNWPIPDHDHSLNVVLEFIGDQSTQEDLHDSMKELMSRGGQFYAFHGRTLLWLDQTWGDAKFVPYLWASEPDDADSQTEASPGVPQASVPNPVSTADHVTPEATSKPEEVPEITSVIAEFYVGKTTVRRADIEEPVREKVRKHLGLNESDAEIEVWISGTGMGSFIHVKISKLSSRRLLDLKQELITSLNCPTESVVSLLNSFKDVPNLEKASVIRMIAVGHDMKTSDSCKETKWTRNQIECPTPDQDSVPEAATSKPEEVLKIIAKFTVDGIDENAIEGQILKHFGLHEVNPTIYIYGSRVMEAFITVKISKLSSLLDVEQKLSTSLSLKFPIRMTSVAYKTPTAVEWTVLDAPESSNRNQIERPTPDQGDHSDNPGEATSQPEVAEQLASVIAEFVLEDVNRRDIDASAKRILCKKFRELFGLSSTVVIEIIFDDFKQSPRRPRLADCAVRVEISNLPEREFGAVRKELLVSLTGIPSESGVSLCEPFKAVPGLQNVSILMTEIHVTSPDGSSERHTMAGNPVRLSEASEPSTSSVMDYLPAWMKSTPAKVAGVLGTAAIACGGYFVSSSSAPSASEILEQRESKPSSAMRTLGPLAAAAGVAAVGYGAWKFSKSRTEPEIESSEQNEVQEKSSRRSRRKAAKSAKTDLGVDPVLLGCLLFVALLACLALCLAWYKSSQDAGPVMNRARHESDADLALS